MLPSARQHALALERERQRQYRENLVIDIEAEVDRRKAAWEAARQEQLAVLRLALSRSLAMVGDGQKQAVDSILAARETAARHGRAWQKISAASVQRHKNAQAVELELRAAQAPTVAHEEGVYRREVQRAAMLHTRRAAHHRARQRHGPPDHAAASAGGTSKRPLSSRMSPFYGPNAAEGRNVIVAERFVAVESLRRTPQIGTPTSTSVVRAPVMLVRPTPLAREGKPNARDAASVASAELESARRSVGDASERRASLASSRGSRAGSAARAAREGMHVLRGLEDCDVQSRASRQAAVSEVAAEWRARSAAAAAEQRVQEGGGSSGGRRRAGWVAEFSAASHAAGSDAGSGSEVAAAGAWAVRAPAAAVTGRARTPGRLGRDAFGLDRAAPLPLPDEGGARPGNPWQPLLAGAYAGDQWGGPRAPPANAAAAAAGGSGDDEEALEGAFLRALLEPAARGPA